MIAERRKSDRRQHSRYSVDWMAAILRKTEENGEVFHDRIFELSLSGAGIYSDTEISTEDPMVMLIEAPLPDGVHRKVIIGIDCALCNWSFSEERQQFRASVRFLRFRGIDKHLLAEALFTQIESVSRRTNISSCSLN
jgi:c-di-GMP-binding flagellar brake protein YcgR